MVCLIFFYVNLLHASPEKYYVVRSGDNLTKIAEKFGVSISDLLQWNKIESLNRLLPGKRLVIGNQTTSFTGTISNAPDFSNPVSSGRLLRHFSDTGEKPSFGIILKVKEGASIKATQDGKVVKSGYLKGYGRYILVDHGGGWLSMYSEIQKILVKTGQVITKKMKIGTTAKNRLHFILAYRGRPVNPEKFW